MKDYKKYARKIGQMGKFCDIHQCGCPTESFPINLSFEFAEEGLKDFRFYVSYSFGKWDIDYCLKKPVVMRADMLTFRGIKTDRDMYATVEKIIKAIRNSVK